MTYSRPSNLVRASPLRRPRGGLGSGLALAHRNREVVPMTEKPRYTNVTVNIGYLHLQEGDTLSTSPRFLPGAVREAKSKVSEINGGNT